MQEMLLGLGDRGETYAHPYGDRFLGEVTTTELITGTALATAIGLTAGVATIESSWLHFETQEGSTLYVMRNPCRHTVSWDQLHARGAVFGTRELTIKGRRFKVRLLKGANSDPALSGGNRDPERSWGSEWNRLLYPVTKPTSREEELPTYPFSGEGILFGSWAGYNQVSVYSLCQETLITDPDLCLVCGASGVTVHTTTPKSNANWIISWRPVLELVE